MKVGQTSLLVFLSKFASSAIGFLATLYFARELGAEILGIYTLVITTSSWIILVGELGIGQAITKRVSENEESGEYLTAGAIWLLTAAVLLATGVAIFKPLFERLVTEFGDYSSASVIWFINGIVIINIFSTLGFRALKGERRVHIAGLLQPVQITLRSVFQVILVIASFSLVGMLVGYLLSGLLVGIYGIYLSSIRLKIPGKRHFESLIEYAKFSWLGSLKSRAFNDVDILLLGVFVPSSLVGVYSIAWSVGRFLDLFGSAISTTMFPEISFSSEQESQEATATLISDSLGYTGLIAIPGFVGGTILSKRLLRIYGPTFERGNIVLVLLIFALLLYSYHRQLINAINGIDRPDLAFRVNAAFITLNIGLNISLIPLFSIEGAAAASILSIGASFVYAYRTLSKQISFRVPIGLIARQGFAGVCMGVVVFNLERFMMNIGIRHNLGIVITLVTIGASLYFFILAVISSQFRETISRNIPTDIVRLL